MGDIQVKDQKLLAPGRILEITLTGIRYRMFRSTITMSVIILAVAFMMNVISEGLTQKSMADFLEKELKGERIATHWASRLTNPGSPEAILTEIGELQSGTERYEETRLFLEMESAELDSLIHDAKDFLVFLNFFQDLDYARHRLLFHRAKGLDIFNQLNNESGWERFVEEKANMRSLRFPTVERPFEDVMAGWTEIWEELLELRKKRKQAIQKIKQKLENQSMMQALKDLDQDFGEVVRNAGFRFSDSLAQRISQLAKKEIRRSKLSETFTNANLKKKVSAHLNVDPKRVNDSLFWIMLDDRNQAKWFAGQLQEQGMDVGFSGEEIHQMALAVSNLESLSEASKQVSEVGGGLWGMGTRMTWLIFLSLLVCGVGITNAMLMTVTERFQEIATLKCLGALDSFIMIMFLMEACIIGFLGGVLGGVLGILLGMGRMLARFAEFLISAFPGGEITIALGGAVLVGVVLAALAAVYPAWVAARLAPMEAMRIE